MNFSEMTLEQLEERKEEILAGLDAPEADLDALTEEMRGITDEIKARIAEKIEDEAKEEARQAEEKRAELRKMVASGEGKVVEKIEEEKREKMDVKELRNSAEYIEKYAEYLKTGDDEEVRAALLTTNAEGGTIAVPDFVYDIVKTAWDKNDIMSLVRRSDLPGNILVNFEISGTDAVFHKEGSGEVEEEELIEGIVKLVPEYAKKWKSFSKSVYALRGEAFVRYIYDELTYRIIKVIADTLVTKIAQLPQTATSESPSAVKITAAPAFGTIAEAIANISDEADDPTIIMNKLTYAAFKKAQYEGNYAADIFEGVRVRFNSKLPAYSAAAADQVYMIVGDLDHGALANFPNGESIEFTFDTISRKKENLVEVLGEVMVAAEVVADKAFTLVAKPNEG